MVWENLPATRILNGSLDRSKILQKGEMVIHRDLRTDARSGKMRKDFEGLYESLV